MKPTNEAEQLAELRRQMDKYRREYTRTRPQK